MARMNTETFERALAAAARLTCCAALLGAGGSCHGGQSDAPDDVSEHSVKPPPAVVVESSAADPNNAEQLAAYRTSRLDACAAMIDQEFAPSDMKRGENPELADCCALVGEAQQAYWEDRAKREEGIKGGLDEAVPAYAEGWMMRGYHCCQINAWDGPECTPWGPPTPPSFERGHEVRSPRAAVLDLRVAASEQARLRFGPAGLRASPALVRRARATWLGRMINEHGSAEVFEGLAAQFDALERSAGFRLDARARGRLQGFAAEERRHGALCGAVVEGLGGRARAPAKADEPFPEHPDARTPIEAALRNVLSIACVAETVAVALIGAERLTMPEGPLRGLLTEIYADECGHANWGWRVLPDLLGRGSAEDPQLRARLGVYLRRAFAELEHHELAHLPARATSCAGVGEPSTDEAALGLCDGSEARRLFYATVERVILPALEHHGVPARAAWRERALA